MVTFVMLGEEGVARAMLYGLTPPVTSSPHGSQVLSVPVTFAVMTGGPDGAGGKHCVSPSERRRRQSAHDVVVERYATSPYRRRRRIRPQTLPFDR